METYQLGPNGSLLYCMEYLLNHIEWLQDKIDQLNCQYIIFDCPGQVELYTHHSCVHEIINYFVKHDYRLCSIYLVDSFYCCEASTFISAVLVVASSMLRLGLPHISILSKIDLLEIYDKLPFQLDFFTEMVDLTPLTRYLDSDYSNLNVKDYGNTSLSHYGEDLNEVSANNKKDSDDNLKNKPNLHDKHKKLSQALCEVVNDLGLVTFLPLDIQNKLLVGKVLTAIDKANGYRFCNYILPLS